MKSGTAKRCTETHDRRAHHHLERSSHSVFVFFWFCFPRGRIVLLVINATGLCCIPFMGNNPRSYQGRGIIAVLQLFGPDSPGRDDDG